MKPFYIILPLVSLTMTSCGLLNKLTVPVSTIHSPRPINTKQPSYTVNKNKDILVGSMPVDMPISTDGTELSNVSLVGPEMFHPSQFKYSILMDVPVEEMVDFALLEFMDKWYGTRYHMGGMDSTGMDCSGFATTYYKHFYNITLPRTSGEQYAKCERVDRSELREGDLVFFHINRRTAVSHVGVYLRNNKFIHASTNKGVVISSLEDDFYNAHFVSGGRFGTR